MEKANLNLNFGKKVKSTKLRYFLARSGFVKQK